MLFILLWAIRSRKGALIDYKVLILIIVEASLFEKDIISGREKMEIVMVFFSIPVPRFSNGAR